MKKNSYTAAMREIFKNSKEYAFNYKRNNDILESCNFIDSSYGNDLCPSYSKISNDDYREIKIHFANSENDNARNEEFTEHSLYFESHYDGDSNNYDSIFLTKDLNEIYSILKSNEKLLDKWLNGKCKEKTEYEVFFDIGSDGLMSKKVFAYNTDEASEMVAEMFTQGMKLIKKVKKL